jgi:hypothetical protein
MLELNVMAYMRVNGPGKCQESVADLPLDIFRIGIRRVSM